MTYLVCVLHILIGVDMSPSSPPAKGTNSKPVNLMDDFFSTPSSNTANGSTTPSYSSFGMFSSETPKRPLLKYVSGAGLGIDYSYVRSPSMLGSRYNTISLILKNNVQRPISNIRIGKTVFQFITYNTF